jgi:hypothetical protein
VEKSSEDGVVVCYGGGGSVKSHTYPHIITVYHYQILYIYIFFNNWYMIYFVA